MRIGLVCPYSFDVPGGVQFHVRDLAEHLIALGHDVGVLAPADDDTPVPPYLTSAGRSVAVPYNGAVGRLVFGPVSARRTRKWVEAGQFDVLHVHEPIVPSVSLLALWAYDGPVVATFHTSNLRSRLMQSGYPLLRPSLEKIVARIAVSEDARRTVTTHLGGDAVVIPNGVDVDVFARADTRPEWTGSAERPTIAFVGRIDEPRKGLPVLCQAVPLLLERLPGVQVLVAGMGSEEDARKLLPAHAQEAVTFLGMVSDHDKASLLRSVDVYVAPHTGQESFGIVLVEAMSAGAPVVASDIDAFARVLEHGELGVLFANRDASALAAALGDLLVDEGRRARLRAAAAVGVRRYDWSVVAQEVLAVYETVTDGVRS
ncbi:glycosyltransferase family 4 protein [Angustibacter sp. Root456]|uniref:glycosyltransferase family 4 protein n=1 Tax=Angustibacter sp. Root456 TaxID=1736539 RepID=UPI0006F953FB|nr:glycosyltransferase family 4 protein [Angustibacter sp. Root456]KQX66748.1 alpha-(1-2)-phosphatidylinositol mannosyltransferase [Angustibacter sp. Root456]